MAVKTYTQSQLNNNMSGTNANAIYYATHGGSGAKPVVYNNGSGNYASADKNGNITYTIGGGAGAGLEDSNGSSSKSGSGSGSNSGNGSYSGSYDTSAYGYSNGGGNGVDLTALMEMQKNAIMDAYGNSMARLDNALNYNRSALKQNLDSTLGRLKSQLDYSNGVVNDDANKSLREAYINYMMNKKNLNQGLSAMGVSGGATESSMAKLFNNYGSSRNNINTTLADNIAKLLNEYTNNAAKAQELWTTQDAESLAQFEQQKNAVDLAKANALVNLGSGSSMAGYASYLNALNSMSPTFSSGNYTSQLANINNTGDYTPTENTLATNLVNTTANNNMGSITDYAKWKAMADSLSSQGANASNIIYQLRQSGAPLDAVYQILGA